MNHLVLTAALANIATASAAFTLPTSHAPGMSGEASAVRFARVDDFTPGLNPRTTFSGIEELAVSIYQNGMLTPLIAREHGGTLQIGAGERRWRALRLLRQGFTFEVAAATEGREAVTVFMQIPADYEVMYQLRDMNDAQMVELAITENSNRADLTVLEKVDVFMVWDSAGMSREEMALRASCSVQTVDAYLRLGYGLGRDARKLYSDGRINFKKAVILASVTGGLKQTLIKAARDGMHERDMQALVKVSAFTVENAAFDVAASGLKIEPRLFESDLPARFEDQRGAMAAQVDALNARAEAKRAAGEWADVVPVETETGTLPPAYQHHGVSVPGTVWTYSTTTGKVSTFEGVRRVSDERAAKKPAKAAPAAGGSVSAPSVPSRSERDDAQADREAQQELIVAGLMNDPRLALVHTVLSLMDAPRADRTVPCVQRFARNISQDKPELLRLLSPGVLGLKVSRAEALGVLRKWSDAALCELLAYLTSAPLKDEAYAAALLDATE